VNNGIPNIAGSAFVSGHILRIPGSGENLDDTSNGSFSTGCVLFGHYLINIYVEVLLSIESFLLFSKAGKILSHPTFPKTIS
jgi:hypothetical protein